MILSFTVYLVPFTCKLRGISRARIALWILCSGYMYLKNDCKSMYVCMYIITQFLLKSSQWFHRNCVFCDTYCFFSNRAVLTANETFIFNKSSDSRWLIVFSETNPAISWTNTSSNLTFFECRYENRLL